MPKPEQMLFDDWRAGEFLQNGRAFHRPQSEDNEQTEEHVELIATWSDSSPMIGFEYSPDS